MSIDNKNKILQISEEALDKIGSYFNLKGKTIASILIFIFNNIIFFPFLSFSIFLVYMLKHNFFSYDFYTDGLFGMKVFTYTLIGVLLLFSLITFGFITLIILRVSKKNRSQKNPITTKMIIVATIFNATMIAFLGYALFNNGFTEFKFYYFIVLLFLLAYLSVHIGFLITSKPLQQIKAAIFLVGVTILMLAYAHDHITAMLGITLKEFGVGGGINIKVVNGQQETLGKLVFLGPKTIYYKTTNNDLVISNTNNLNIYILDGKKKQIKND